MAAKESQIPAHVDSRKKGDILVQCQIIGLAASKIEYWTFP
jgi:hypothetical protein